MNVDALKELDACKEAVDWAATRKSRKDAWESCGRGDWMLWILGRLSGPPGSRSRKKLVGCLADVVALAVPYAGPNKGVCETTIGVCRKYAAGEASLDELRSATAADAADAARAYAAAAAAAYAARVATAATTTAADAAYATAVAARVATVATAADAGNHKRYEVSREVSRIVRKHFPNPPRRRR